MTIPERVQDALQHYAQVAEHDCSPTETAYQRRLYFRSLVLAWVLRNPAETPGLTVELLAEVGRQLEALDVEQDAQAEGGAR